MNRMSTQHTKHHPVIILLIDAKHLARTTRWSTPGCTKVKQKVDTSAKSAKCFLPFIYMVVPIKTRLLQHLWLICLDMGNILLERSMAIRILKSTKMRWNSRPVIILNFNESTISRGQVIGNPSLTSYHSPRFFNNDCDLFRHLRLPF